MPAGSLTPRGFGGYCLLRQNKALFREEREVQLLLLMYILLPKDENFSLDPLARPLVN